MTKQIMDVIAEYGYASVPLLQKRCALSYKQACAAIDELLQDGLVSFSDRLIYVINQSKFYKAYGDYCDGSIEDSEYTGELVADNAKLSKYVMEFYKKALLHVIRTQEVRAIDIATTFHVNPVITMRAISWMKQNGYIEKKPDRLSKPLITEQQVFEKLGRIRGYGETFEDMYNDAVLLCIKHKTYDKSLIASNFVASNSQLADFDEWMDKNGYKPKNPNDEFLLTREKFFKMCGAQDEEIKDITDIYDLFDDEDDDYDIEIDEDEVRKIIEDATEPDSDELFCKVKAFYQKHFSAVFGKDYPHLGFIKSSRITIIEFRLRVQNGKIRISRCGYAIKKEQKLKAQSILSDYENVYIIDDEAVVEFTDVNYAGAAMLTLYAVTERLSALRKK